MRPAALLIAFTCLLIFPHPTLFAGDVVITQSTVLTSDIDGDLVITNGASVLAQDIQVSGDVYVHSLASLFGKGLIIHGRLRVILSSNLTLRESNENNSMVMGDVEVQSCVGGIRLFGTNFNGQVLLENNSAYDIIIKNCNFNRDVQLFFNDVQRKIVFRENVLAGDWQAYRNRPSPVLIANQIGGARADGSFIAIKARGHEGDEQLELHIDGVPVRSWTAIRSFREFRYRASTGISPDRIRVAFVNDEPDNTGFDRILIVDQLNIRSRQFPTESVSVYSTGTWLPHDGIQPGYRQSEALHVNGYFQFDWPARKDRLIKESLEAVLPAGWNYFLTDDGFDVRLSTFGPNGGGAFDVRFGSAGVISELHDSTTAERLNASSYQGEATDRVLQWTIWEIGPGLRYDHPSLPPFEDRFNLTQAGTSNNTFQKTVQVSVDPPSGQLDVWAVCDRLWKSELDPYMDGSITSLTRTTALQGGAVLVRRVIRLGETRLLGNQTDFDNPYFEAWTPFSDSAFNSMALSIDENGIPDEFYMDSINIPHYPERPVADTRGWAMVYDRNQLESAPNVAVVFGRDLGRVFREDGSTTEPRRYVLNSLDFEGGMAILPGFWAADLPNGSLIDQWLLFVPSHGIDESTAQRLDQLAARLPAPQVFHPGASMDGEMQSIANRLKNLPSEPSMATDHLGLVK